MRNVTNSVETRNIFKRETSNAPSDKAMKNARK